MLKSILSTTLSSHDQNHPGMLAILDLFQGEKLGLKAELTPAKWHLLKQQRSRPQPRKEQLGDGTKAGGVRQENWDRLYILSVIF